MPHISLLIGVVFCVATVSGYCIRPGHRCYNGECPNFDKCECFSPLSTGHDCWLPTVYTMQCANPCSNHGVCFYGSQCYCDFGYFGRDCEFKNDTATCNSEYMFVNVHTDRYRNVFLSKHRQCEFEFDGNKLMDDIFAYRLDLPLEPMAGSPCDGITKEVSGNFTTYKILVEVRDQENQIAPFDYITEFTCTVERKGTGEVMEALSDEASTYGVIFLDELKNPLKHSVEKSLRFSIAFYPMKQTGVYQVDVIDLKVTDDKTSRKMYDILLEGCTTETGERMLETLPQRDVITLPNGDRKEATIIPFKPLGTAFELFFDYKVKLCPERCHIRECKTEPMHESIQGIRLTIF